MNPVLKSALAAVLISPRTRRLRRAWYGARRRLTRSPHRAIFYHRIDDAWSWLLAQLLPELTQRYGVELDLRLIAELPIDAVHDPAQLDRYAAYDARRLSRAWSLRFSDSATPPDQRLCRLAARIVLAAPRLPTLLAATAAAWHRDEDRLACLARDCGAAGERQAEALLARNHAELVRRGHYLGGMLWYGGEWYWGLDRLRFLEERLRDLGLGGGAAVFEDERFAPLRRERAGSPVTQTLELYFSFRSPYSYLAVHKAGLFADRLGLYLQLRPLLPMVNRGLAVPRSKLRYILTDAARVARAQGILFGPLRDPLGDAVETCLAVAVEAERAGRGREFTLAAMRAIWTRAANPGRRSVLLAVAAEAGVPADAVDRALASPQWRARAEANAAALAVLGLWGVPCLCLRGADERPVALAWGQDRFWAIERAAVGIDAAMPATGLAGEV